MVHAVPIGGVQTHLPDASCGAPVTIQKWRQSYTMKTNIKKQILFPLSSSSFLFFFYKKKKKIQHTTNFLSIQNVEDFNSIQFSNSMARNSLKKKLAGIE